MATVATVAVAFAGLLAGLQPIRDNSFLTHLATGRLILTHGIPRTDPYSFTATGQQWTVQSWLPSVLYAAVERLAGGIGLVFLSGLLNCGLALCCWRLTRRAHTLAGRLVTIIGVLLVSIHLWAPRPLLIGLLCLAVTIIIAAEDHSPWWLLPVGWLWVNSHGSFPLGPAYLGLALVGAAIDRRPLRQPLRLLAASSAGVLLGALGPLGPRILVFPFHLLARHHILSNIVEWRSPDFSSPINLAFLGLLIVTLVGARRQPYRDVLPAAVFGALGCMALRNVAPAAVVLAPLLAATTPWREPRAMRRERSAGLTVLALCVAAVLTAIAVTQRPAYDFHMYPVSPLQWMARTGLLQQRVAAPDFVGNYRTFAEGAHHEVFEDDRFDMYPPSLTLQTANLAKGRPGWDATLDTYQVDVVLWPSNLPLAELVRLDPRWNVVARMDGWTVAVRR